MRTVALVLAAGRGERLGHPLPKGFVPLAGRPLLLHALEALEAVAEIERVVPVIPPGALPRYREALAGASGLRKLAEPVAGGRERQDSVRAGLAALAPGVELVAVHDAARPLVRPAAVRRVIEAARAAGAAILAAPVRDTVKRVVDGRVVGTPPRGECWAAQTPQVFRVELLREALAKAEAEGVVGTDDAQLVEALGVEVRVVAGDPDNLKVTGPEDLVLAERLLLLRRQEQDRRPEEHRPSESRASARDAAAGRGDDRRPPRSAGEPRPAGERSAEPEPSAGEAGR